LEAAVRLQRLVNLQAQQEHLRVLELIAPQVELVVVRVPIQVLVGTESTVIPETSVEISALARMVRQIPAELKMVEMDSVIQVTVVQAHVRQRLQD
jgi:acyl transferase domain-containing protein